MNNTVTYVVDYKSLAVLPFIVFLVVFIISLIRLKVKKKKPTVLWIISGVFLVGAICSVVKRVDTFLNTIFRKDRITPGFPCRTPLFHLVYNHQAKSEGV